MLPPENSQISQNRSRAVVLLRLPFCVGLDEQKEHPQNFLWRLFPAMRQQLHDLFDSEDFPFAVHRVNQPIAQEDHRIDTHKLNLFHLVVGIWKKSWRNSA